MLHLYDTRTRTAQDISPMDEKTLRFYCCGPTVYGPAHIGNFRTFVMQDVFRRVLELGGGAHHAYPQSDGCGRQNYPGFSKGWRFSGGIHRRLGGSVPPGLCRP